MQRVLKGEKPESTEVRIGMPWGEFKIFIQGQFRTGMTWENCGSVWQFDHVKPLAKFNLLLEEERRAAVRWDNYQPLFSRENAQKGAR
jgi:hypothetical protein